MLNAVTEESGVAEWVVDDSEVSITGLSRHLALSSLG